MLEIMRFYAISFMSILQNNGERGCMIIGTFIIWLDIVIVVVRHLLEDGRYNHKRKSTYSFSKWYESNYNSHLRTFLPSIDKRWEIEGLFRLRKWHYKPRNYENVVATFLSDEKRVILFNSFIFKGLNAPPPNNWEKSGRSDSKVSRALALYTAILPQFLAYYVVPWALQECSLKVETGVDSKQY